MVAQAAPDALPPTPMSAIDEAVKSLVDHRNVWASLAIPARIELLRRMMDDTVAAGEDWVRTACAAKRIDFDSPAAAEEWFGGPITVMRNLRLFLQTLRQIQTEGRPSLPDSAVRVRPDGQVVARVFPQGLDDKILYSGFTAEVWMEPQVRRDQLRDTMARIYQKGQKGQNRVGKVALVLGAGNVASIGPMDVLHKLYVENQVCVLKMNPVNEWSGPLVERCFRALVDAGFLRVVYGGADVGEALVHHAGVEEIHITGSDRVHDIIVWGAGDEQAKNRKAGTPKIKKRITSELGCVTPVIIVPGEWSDKELQFQAENVATMVANNASFNCNAAKALVVAKSWRQRGEFLSRVEAALRTIPRRYAYYPGSDRKYEAFLAAHPDARLLGERTPDAIPWTLIPNVDSSDRDEVCFNTEAWCGVLAETALDGDDAAAFLRNAVNFCNDVMWGTLSCSLVVHPSTARALGPALDQAVADLRYGSVGVNHWAAMSYALVVTTWGAYPGHTLDDIRSGIGTVHNALMFEHPQKSVVWGPFTMFPKPPWFATHKNSHRVAPKILAFEHSPSLFRVPGIAIAAMKG